MSISAIVEDVLETKVLTLKQRSKISHFLDGRDLSERDATAMLNLVQALSCNSVSAIHGN